jgi:hypothetical protein
MSLSPTHVGINCAWGLHWMCTHFGDTAFHALCRIVYGLWLTPDYCISGNQDVVCVRPMYYLGPTKSSRTSCLCRDPTAVRNARF